MGLSGQVPHRVDTATKAGLLELIDAATDAGWSLRRACHELELPELRVHRWRGRRVAGRLADHPPGGSPMHGLLPEEATEILALFDQWGEVDRSHRKLAAWERPRIRRVLRRLGIPPVPIRDTDS